MKRQSKAFMPTQWGEFEMIAYAEEGNDFPHVALVRGNILSDQPVLVRLHSECMTGDLFGSKRCDCGEQLHASMKRIAREGGVLIYLRQEGRGIGLVNKLHAYNLQDEGYNTIDANTHLGFEADARDYSVAIEILKDLGISQMYLMTNNPQKIEAFEESSIEVVRREPVIIPPKKENQYYLQTKKDLMGHLLDAGAGLEITPASPEKGEK